MFPCTTAEEEEEKFKSKVELRRKGMVDEEVLKI